MHTVRLDISYDGTNYSGWQIQPNARSIQGCIQSACQIILREPVKLIGAGRTDAGVHATGQVAHFRCDRDIDFYTFLGSLNGILDPDIRVHHASFVDADFHSQYSAKSKIYHYHICLKRFHDPSTRLYRLHLREPIDIPLLKKAAPLFVGTHDFTSFANKAHEGAASRSPVRTIKRLDVVESDELLTLEYEANGFLYKMVRNITGTLLKVATHKLGLEEIQPIFEAKDRRRSALAAPANGLFLVHVEY